jgi:sec-independent protein translocase protein TatA
MANHRVPLLEKHRLRRAGTKLIVTRGGTGAVVTIDCSKESLMLESIGMPELLVILVLAVLLFGSSKIPELAKGLGEGIRNFKESMKS